MLSHEHYMSECLALAAQGAGNVAPNPLVGAVIVHRGNIIGRGYHERFGGPHAEVNAVQAVSDPTLLRESTLYVSLEPCCHFGKTPPCADLIIETGIPRVVIGITDIFAKVAGGGIKKLRDAGVEVVTNVSADACFEINRRFFVFHALKRPYIILKWAKTADDFIARVDGTSRWISGAGARTEVHRWRAEEAAIMVGRCTAEVDNPALTVRGVAGKNPLRIVLDRQLSLPSTLQLFDRATPTLVFNTVRDSLDSNLEYVKGAPGLPFPEIMSNLHERGVLSVLIEGGATLLRSALEFNMWDEARIFRNPHLTFGSGLPAPSIAGTPWSTLSIDTDTLTVYRQAHLQGVKERCVGATP